MIMSTLTGDTSTARENASIIDRPPLPMQTTGLAEEKPRGALTGADVKPHPSAAPRSQRLLRREPHSTLARKLKPALDLLDQINRDDIQNYTLAISSLSAMLCALWSDTEGLSDLHRQALAAVENAVCCLVAGDAFSQDKLAAIRMGLTDMAGPVLTRESLNSLNFFLIDAGFPPAPFIASEAD